MEAVSCRKSGQEIGPDHGIHPIQLSLWNKKLHEGAREVFIRGNKTNYKQAGQVKGTKRVKQFDRLQMELEWLKTLRSYEALNSESWSIRTTLN